MVDETISIDDRILSALLNHRECVVSAKEIDKIPMQLPVERRHIGNHHFLGTPLKYTIVLVTVFGKLSFP